MGRRLVAAAIAAGISISVAVPAIAGDYTRLAYAAGIRAAEGGAATLGEIAAIKFDREGHDNRQVVVRASRSGTPQAVGSHATLGQSLDDYYLGMLNRSSSGDERQVQVRRNVVYANPLARRQLAAAAIIAAADADTMSLGTIAERKFNQDTDSRIASR